VDSLKALDPTRPIREADIARTGTVAPAGKKSKCWRTGVAPLAFSDDEIVLIEIDGEHSKHEVLSGPGAFS
jgi:hypothetical protein